MLMHADYRGVDHLDSGIVGSSKRVYDAAPDPSPPSTDEAVVACGVRTNISGRSRQGAPDRKTQKMPLRTRRSLTRGMPRGLFGSTGFMRPHSQSLSS